MKAIFISLVLFTITGNTFAQYSEKALSKLGANPVLFLDSTEVDMDSLWKVDPLKISNIDIYLPKKAFKLLGEKGADGIVYVTTIKAARERYQRFFGTKSKDYSKLFGLPNSDSSASYVVNGQLLIDKAAPGVLSQINDSNFKNLSIIDKEQINADNVIPKRYVVPINARRMKKTLKRQKTE